jgi:hypothetical protein
VSVPNPATTDWVPIFAGGNPLAYRADWAAGTTYVDGDIVVKDGVAYLCAGGPTSVAPDIAPWGGAVANRPPGELAYAEFTAPVTISATTLAAAQTVVTAPPVTVDGVTPLLVEFSCPYMLSPTANSLDAYLFMDGVSLGVIARNFPSGGTTNFPVRAARRLTPAAGARTFSVRGVGGAGGGQFYAGVGDASQGTFLPSFIRVTQANPVLIAPAGPTVPTYGLALPSSPADGQEHVLVDSLTAPTWQWRFRFNAAKASNKWDFIGGTARYAEILPKETVPTGTPGDCATVGPSFAVPVAGLYELTVGCHSEHLAPGGYAYMSYAIGATAADLADGTSPWTDGGRVAVSTRTQVKTFTAVTLTAKYFGSASLGIQTLHATSADRGGRMSVTPYAPRPDHPVVPPGRSAGRRWASGYGQITADVTVSAASRPPPPLARRFARHHGGRATDHH